MPQACRTTARDLAMGCRTKPHIALFSPSEKWVLAAEIATDAVAIYRFDAKTGSLALHSLAPGQQGGGPRHLAWGRDGRFLYSSDEHGSQVSVWRWDDRTGKAIRLQSLSTLPAGFAGRNTTAHIAVHPGGSALWVSNRGHPSIAGFIIDPMTGLLTAAGHTPTGSKDCWCFDIDRSGQWLLAALMTSDEVAVYRIDSRSAALERTPQRIIAPFPTCLRMA
jgi:6-phosphogluconolactonase